MADVKAAGRPPPRDPGARRLPVARPFSRCGAGPRSLLAQPSTPWVVGSFSFGGDDVTVMSPFSAGGSGSPAPRLAGRTARCQLMTVELDLVVADRSTVDVSPNQLGRVTAVRWYTHVRLEFCAV